jgi:K+-transporting ATPase c subunit
MKVMKFIRSLKLLITMGNMEDANSQIPRISKTTGLPQGTLKTSIQYNVEKKVSNVLVFAPPYVNVDF